MKTLNWVLGIALLAALGCGGGSGGEGGSGGSGPKLDLASRKAEVSALQQVQGTLKAKREELTSLRSEALAGANVGPSIDSLNAEISRLSDDFGRRVVEYINADPPIVGEAIRPDQLDGIRLKTGEDMAIAREYIELGGDYKRAIDIYDMALQIDPDNPELRSAKAEAEAKRYMSLDRFRAVQKGMTEAQVIAALGRPLNRNIRDYPDKNVSAWFYPKGETGEAAGVFFNAGKKVYSTDFNAVKRNEGGEAGGE